MPNKSILIASPFLVFFTLAQVMAFDIYGPTSRGRGDAHFSSQQDKMTRPGRLMGDSLEPLSPREVDPKSRSPIQQSSRFSEREAARLNSIIEKSNELREVDASDH